MYHYQNEPLCPSHRASRLQCVSRIEPRHSIVFVLSLPSALVCALLRRLCVEHLASVESPSRLQADRPPPDSVSRPRPRLSFLHKLAWHPLLSLSRSSCSFSPHAIANQQAPHAGRTPAAFQIISMPSPLPLSVSLTHPSILSPSIPSGAIHNSPAPPLPGP
jgi:hypothetical protein